MRRLGRFAVLGLMLGLLGRADAEVAYTVTYLGTLDPNAIHCGRAEGINNHGTVAGSSPTAFSWANGTMTSLGTFGGAGSDARSVNDSGWVVGDAATRTAYHRAFLWKGSGGLIDLTGKNGSIAWSINNLGQVAGQANYKGFIWQNGKVTYLPTYKSGASATAYTINNNGVAAGVAYTGLGDSPYLGCYWKGGKLFTLPWLDTAYPYAFVMGSNDSDQFVGAASITTPYGGRGRAVLWKGGKVIRLDYLGERSISRADDINNPIYKDGVLVRPAQVVGYINYPDAPTEPSLNRAFIWSDTNNNDQSDPGEMTDLNNLIDPALGYFLAEGHSINDLGQIACAGRDASGKNVALLLTPITPRTVPSG